ncbi:Protein FMP42 [Exophiala dermatitidis]|uniref:MFS transporter, LAT3 family, solute carrier family 43, member 3 n=1 Tax=Exophiala dermatitidis (strain ATCC 34100 / CBS 525.76 / NIH/UT8656) TaxID=858893 RepID=H6C9R0_EXODN|nr:MFS transporter, LAT3 family, solute carrier family 43, member 3 [Exophiala dermatitidis NIH/UT8656]EHY60776.1 MFS transporter, LAT3 family, solute carrier family 43, member 3 [Exophiala dermatitidis NIH/UT8656]
MSLAQHVSTVEGVDDDPDICCQPLTRQASVAPSISYDPLPNVGHRHEKLQTLAPYEVPAPKRLAQVIVGVLSCVTASGIVFGFDALKTILIDEKIYRKYCSAEELRENVRVCYMQDQRLNLIFVIASVTANLSALLVGRILDRHGPRICGIFSAILLALGSLLMAYAQDLPFDVYYAGSFLISLGGTFTFVPTFHLSNTFPRFQGLILALVTGAFDASASVFLIFRLLYQATHHAFGPRQIFLVYLVVPAFILITQLTMMPSRSYDTRVELETRMERAQDPAQDVHESDEELNNAAEIMRVRSQRASRRRQSITSINELLGGPAEQQEHEKKEHEKRVTSGVFGVLHGVPASKQFRTPWFILITLFTVLQMARFNFFISTIWSQYVYMLGSEEEAMHIIEYFDLALPIGGIATVPFIGALLDHTSTVAVLNLLVLMSTLIGVLGAVPTVWAAYANVTLFCLFRPLYYSAMSDYAAKVFGYSTFGTVYGAIICLSGLFTFTQSGLQALVHNTFDDDPEPLNLALATAGLVLGVILVMYVDIKGRQIQRERQQAAARNGRAGAGAGGNNFVPDERWSLLRSGPNTQNGTAGGGGAGYGAVSPGTAAATGDNAVSSDDSSDSRRGGGSLRGLNPRSSRQTLKSLSTVQETGEA